VTLRRTGIRSRRKPTGFDRPTQARIFDRDGDRCCLCGFVFARRDLAAHHRRNRGSGGSTSPETNDIRNGLTLCWGCNGLIESNADRAREARERGIKLNRWQPLDTPVYYSSGYPYLLLENGQRRQLRWDEVA
jgi:5-methylcytosine-specific restriction protein A